MNETLRKIIKPIIPKGIWDGAKALLIKRKERERQKAILKKWYADGCPAPPPHIIKQRVIREYREKFGPKVFVETGTYLGDMVEAQKRAFEKIFSIELGLDLYESAKKRFESDSKVTILHGDSGKVLPQIMDMITEPAIFWLDGHYSGDITAKGDLECPILAEIDAIFAKGNQNHILLIDDARCFNGEGDYPTVDALVSYVKNKKGHYTFSVEYDIIRFISQNN